MLFHFCLKCMALTVWDYGSANLTATLQDSDNSGLILGASAGNTPLPRGCVHITGLATDEGFVRFHFTGELVDCSNAQCEPNPMIHKPRSFLSHADRPVNLVGTDAILAVHHLPHCSKPLVESDR